MFTEIQLKQLSDKGIDLEQALGQLEIFKNGISPVRLINPAIPGDGIEVYNKTQTDSYLELFRKKKQDFPTVKFVPASGAASRMFKALFEALNELINNPYDTASVLQKMPEIEIFFRDLASYAFYDDLRALCLANGSDPETMAREDKHAELLNLLLSSGGLAYGDLPKGLLKFHKYPGQVRTAFEEHFIEAAEYLKDSGKMVRMHFTVSPEHLILFESLSAELIKKYSENFKLHFDVSFSAQKPSTDTIAVDMENKPFLAKEGKLLFRPGGHGALLDNMQDIPGKMVFVSNIDNVAPDRLKKTRVRYKELLAGILIERLDIIHFYLDKLEAGYSDNLKSGILEFTGKFISPASAEKLSGLADREFLSEAKNTLNRPVRVCGMVKNVGEPGGGPFWIADKSGKVSKQIIESSQVDLKNPEQAAIFNNATHFNPVDMVCYTYDYKKMKFNLKDFRDPDMAFIAVKSQGGNPLKALELPGLWNGSMAGWITFFVDVPVETFSPVKTIFDLRREEHIS